MVDYEAFYHGIPASLDYGGSGGGYVNSFQGYGIPAGSVGATTSIRTANQLKEVSNLLNQGIKNVEISLIQKDIFDQIPKEQFEDIARLQKLTGTEVSLHAPMIDPSGFIGNRWSEEARVSAERQFEDTILRGHKFKPGGNISITIHSGGSPDSMIPGSVFTKEGGKKVTDAITVINKVDGSLNQISRDKEYYSIGDEKPHSVPAENFVRTQNHGFWEERISQLTQIKARGDRLIDEPIKVAQPANTPSELAKIQQLYARDINDAGVYFETAEKTLNSLYSYAMKNGDDKVKAYLKEVSKGYLKEQEAAIMAMNNNNSIEQLKHSSEAINTMLHAINNGFVRSGAPLKTPQVIVPIEEFALEKASKTFSNLVVKAYDRYKDSAPIINIENPPFGVLLSTGDDMKNLVERSRNETVKKLVDEGYSESKARSIANKHIGITWDTVHSAAMRRQGFGDEEIISEAKKVASYVKHMHMNDSLGGSTQDLPPGMGDVPLKQIMQEFDKKGFAGNRVFEGGAFFAMHQTSPHIMTLANLNSPVMESGAVTWSDIAGLGGQPMYYSGLGPNLPDYHFSVYGGGHTGLPVELGGQQMGGGARSRFSGTPMN